MRMKKLAVMALATALSVGSVMTASAAWLQEGSNWRYQNDNGTFQTGTWFRDADGRWYHFDNNGIMQKGWFQDADGKWYFLAYNGVMQVGLIKVDNQVYYMGTSGDLFIGDMAINGTTYNFGLYGTTNGQPSVPSTATFGGNGNQSLPGGGGSSSNTSKDKTPAEKVDGAVNEVSSVADTLEESTGNKVKATVKPATTVGNKAEVAVSVVASENLNIDTDVETVQDAVSEVVSTVLSTADEGTDVVVNIKGIPLNHTEMSVKTLMENGKYESLIKHYVTPDNYKKASTAEVTVTVNGVEVTYQITLNK